MLNAHPMSMDTLVNTRTFFEKAVPEPAEKNFTTQLGVHAEEFGEMLDALTFITPHGQALLDQAKTAVKKLAGELKAGTADLVLMPGDRIEMLDALCDQLVTATGVGHMLKMNVVGALDEVNRSNLSKFDDNGEPIFDENRKVMKGPNYSAADLTPYI